MELGLDSKTLAAGLSALSLMLSFCSTRQSYGFLMVKGLNVLVPGWEL